MLLKEELQREMKLVYESLRYCWVYCVYMLKGKLCVQAIITWCDTTTAKKIFTDNKRKIVIKKNGIFRVLQPDLDIHYVRVMR